MSEPLPHPNIEPPPGALLDRVALAAIFAEIQRNLDALITQPTGPRIVRGYVDSAGNITAGSGFSVTHSEAGVYVVSYKAPFTGTPAVAGNDAQGTQRTMSVSGETGSGCIVTMSDGTGSKEDIPFSFIAIG